ncbi:hypothetical protein GCM10023334_028500 [Nonomuraea thailandensis]
MSAYGQESWAQRELQKLRRERPDWAFLVVRNRWLALRGKHSVIVAAGPAALRAMLPETSGDRLLSVVGPEMDHAEPQRAETVDVPGTELIGPMSAVKAGVLPARLSGTGTWVAIPRRVRRTGRRPWRWPWSRRRARHARKRTESRKQVRGRKASYERMVAHGRGVTLQRPVAR